MSHCLRRSLSLDPLCIFFRANLIVLKLHRNMLTDKKYNGSKEYYGLSLKKKTI